MDVSTDLYCFIVTHPFEDKPRAFLTTLANEPFHVVARHNQKTCTATDLRDAAPFCYLARIAGPFIYERSGKYFAHDLIHGTRGVKPLCDRIELLANAYGVSCYSMDVPLGIPLPQFLAQHGATARWIEAATRLEEAQRVLDTASVSGGTGGISESDIVLVN